MIRLPIPLTGADAEIFIGPAEWDAFCRASGDRGKLPKLEDGTLGYCAGTVFWFRIRRPSAGLVAHEVSHCMDEIAASLEIEREPEFRARLTEYLVGGILANLRRRKP